MRNRTSLAVAGLALGLLAFGRPAHLRADQGGSNLPFMGVAAGEITGVAPSGAVVIESTRNATHLGEFTRTEYVFFGPGGEISGAVVFTAANGDQLWADFSGGFISRPRRRACTRSRAARVGSRAARERRASRRPRRTGSTSPSPLRGRSLIRRREENGG